MNIRSFDFVKYHLPMAETAPEVALHNGMHETGANDGTIPVHVANSVDLETLAVGTKRIRENDGDSEEFQLETATRPSVANENSIKNLKSIDPSAGSDASKIFSRSKYKCSHCGQV